MIKLRTISYHNGGEPVKGLTVPREISVFFENTMFNIQKSGTSIIFTSGTEHIITRKDVINFKFKEVEL